MIVHFHYVHAQQQNHLVLAHISNRVNMLNEKFQSHFATAMFSFIHLID
jgi:hypothetical protein